MSRRPNCRMTRGSLLFSPCTLTPCPKRLIVFVVGLRSGTTLLATLLDHSRIAATPETHFFSQVLPRGTLPTDSYDSKRLVSTFFESERVRGLGLTPEDFAPLLERKKCTWRDVFSHALATYATRYNARIVVEKTPAHMTKTPRILEWYPGAKMIHIIRDGRDAGLSLLRAPWTHNNLRRHARTWRWCIKRMAQFRKTYPGSILEIRFEQLLAHPEGTLREISEFIGVSFEPTQLQPADGDRTVPAWESEWKAKASAELDRTRIQAWKWAATQPQRWVMNSMIGDILREYGYDDTTLAGCPIGFRIPNAFLNAVFLVAYHPRLKPALLP